MDVVQDIGAANACLLEQLCTHMKYVTYEAFCDRLAPAIWPAVTTSKRRFIAWHDLSVNYDGLCKLMLAVR